MIGVVGYFAGATRSEEHFYRATVFAAEIVEIRDVVVGLIAKKGHVVANAEFTGSAIAIERLGKIVQADEAHGHVVEGDGGALPIFVMGERFVGTLVVEHGFFETVLAVEDVADVVVETGDAAGFADLREDFSRAFGRFESAVVFAEQDQRLDGTAEGAGCFFPIAEGLVPFDGLFVMLDGGAIVSAGVESVCFGAGAEGEVFFASQFAADQDGGFGKVQRFFSVYADFFQYQIRELLYNFAAE